MWKCMGERVWNRDGARRDYVGWDGLNVVG